MDDRLRGFDPQRFLSRVLVRPGCWLWNGPHLPGGYGTLTNRVDGRVRGISAHRTSYELFIGPIPEGMEIDHLCFNRECVRPDHLEVVTRQENSNRSDYRRRRRGSKRYPTPETERVRELATLQAVCAVAPAYRTQLAEAERRRTFLFGEEAA